MKSEMETMLVEVEIADESVGDEDFVAGESGFTGESRADRIAVLDYTQPAIGILARSADAMGPGMSAD